METNIITRADIANTSMGKCDNLIDLVDFHSHILPGADHGSYSVSESETQLDLAYQFGVRRIIATPHFYPNSHTVEDFLKRREQALGMLYRSFSEERPSVILGAEVLACRGIEKMPGLEKLFISGTHTLLFELPYSGFDEECVVSVSSLVKDGVDVVLAHADRYEINNVMKLVAAGARVQLNADSVCSFFKRRRCKPYLDGGHVVALGSDIHNRNISAYKHFSKAISILSKHISFIKEESDKVWERAFSKK